MATGGPFPSGLHGRIWDRCFACDGPCPGWAAGTFPTLNYAGRSWNCGLPTQKDGGKEKGFCTKSWARFWEPPPLCCFAKEEGDGR